MLVVLGCLGFCSFLSGCFRLFWFLLICVGLLVDWFVCLRLVWADLFVSIVWLHDVVCVCMSCVLVVVCMVGRDGEDL